MKAISTDSGVKRERAILAVSLVAVVSIGMIIPLIPWWPLILVIATLVLLISGVLWPLYALLITLAIIFEVIPAGYLMSLGHFRPHDLMLGYLAFVIALRAVFHREPLFAPLREFRWPLLFLVLCIAMSATYARYFARNEFLLAELRNYVTWLVLPMLLLVVRTERQRHVLINAMLAIGLVMALIVIVQSLFDVRILTQARVEKLDDEANADVTRSIADGANYLMVFGLFYFLNALAAGRRYALFLGGGSLLLVAGLAVTFGRAVWVATGVGLLLATLLNRGIRGVLITGVVGASVVVAALALGTVIKPRLVEAIVDRASGFGEEVERGGSFGWRALENRAAVAAIEGRHFTGVGLGGEYKRSVSLAGSFEHETIYIHNAYVAYPLKMGLHAALFPPWMILCFVVVARRALRSGRPADRPLQAGLIGAFIVPVITSYTQPMWVERQGVAAFCMIIAALLISCQAVTKESDK